MPDNTPAAVRPPLPPFTPESAAIKVRAAEDAWNSRDPQRVSLAYTEDSMWRNRAEFPRGRAQIVEFLQRKWNKELEYRLIKELWACAGNRIAVRFAYEWHDAGNWFRSYGNENWEFDERGLMARRYASINDLPIPPSERLFHWIEASRGRSIILASRSWACNGVAKLINERSDVLPVLVEVFREHGYDGTSLSVISKRTGLGKGSLYNFFPDGKEEMARAVLAEIDGWFERAVFTPLRSSVDPQVALGQMFDGVVEYFQSGRRACLVGAFALASSRDLFGAEIESYFKAWRDDLKRALIRRGADRKEATVLAEETLSAIQGALVVARALDEPRVFSRAIARLRTRLDC